MIIPLLHREYQYNENNKTCDAVMANNTENIALISGSQIHAIFYKPLEYNKKNGMIISLARKLGQPLFPKDLILNFPNFGAKNWLKHILFQFLKKQGDKIFF